MGRAAGTNAVTIPKTIRQLLVNGGSRIPATSTMLIQPNKKKEEPMNMIPLSSTNLAAIGYDEEGNTLRVEFRTGGTSNRVSHGQYLAQNIKGHYRTRGFRFPSFSPTHRD